MHTTLQHEIDSRRHHKGADDNHNVKIRGAMGFNNTDPVVQSTGYGMTNVSESKTGNADSVDVAALADIVGTLIVDLKATGIIG